MLGPSLHRAYDPVLREPVPEALLAASGIGSASPDVFGNGWRTPEGPDHDGGMPRGR